MIHRSLRPSRRNSFFLFGPRGTGKTTFLKHFFEGEKPLWINLLNPAAEARYASHPESLGQEIAAKPREIRWVVIDEVQKAPRLLDAVHDLIESAGVNFALTGSSPRKLKAGAANLLAGRAFVTHLFPLTHVEMGERFDLLQTLRWGSLPRPTLLDDPRDKAAFLRAYALTYLKEEIWAEHIIRRLDPFRKFLEIAAQGNGDIVNFSRTARDVGSDTKTVQSYYTILEDTLVGVLLEPFHRSLRKRQRANPKFYLFDLGVKRALDGTLTEELTERSYAFGRAFEHLVIVEAHRLNSYYAKDYRFSYLRTKDDAEIDLIVERPGRPLALVEIKSTDRVEEEDVRTLRLFLKDAPEAEAFCLSRDPRPKKIGPVLALSWQEGLGKIGLTP